MAESDKSDADEGALSPSSLDKYTAIDLEGLSEDEVFKVIIEALDKLPITRFAELRTHIEERQEEHRQEVREMLLKRFEEQAAQEGVELKDLFPQMGSRRQRADTQQRVKPMYRHPETGDTWAGRGMEARWIREAKERGEDIEKYRIQDEEE